MKTDQIIVILLCTAAAIGVIVYEILRVKKICKEYLLVNPLDVYDIDKFFYIIGIIFIGITYLTYFSHNHKIQWEYVEGVIIMFLGPKVEKYLKEYGAKQDKSNMDMDNRIKNINDYHRKHSK